MAGRRVALPAADDLFRPTAAGADSDAPAKRSRAASKAAVDAEDKRGDTDTVSGRVRHDEKMTVYVTSDELLDLEHARLEMRREFGIVVDRGRLVREALAIVLAEFKESGATSALVRRLSEE